MKRIIGIPTTNGMLDEHFGHCRQFTMFQVDKGTVLGITYLDAPPHQPGTLPPWLSGHGATDVIAGGLGQKAIVLFNQLGVNVFTGAPRTTPEEIIDGYLKESISFSSNYCDHKEHSCK